eukprot:CAMPEP_0172308538 /NCGR_PEP_ID=MMETSP1058-20130122/9101_1 /TAXON_ID=83371 /ORGANISM="Detonula confervacea, Strain CCMP 353" /LENGTH=74 /DNA_ID=CAMNT_0013020975 /DNA_START=302 /DNA_END=526 /DNA_ORIENTATION=+
MGACLSSDKGGHLDQVDDSVHVMLAHDRKKRKESGNATTNGYKPRAANPALEQKRAENAGDAGEEKTEETANGD